MEHLIFQILDPTMEKSGHSHSHAHILLPLTKHLDVLYKSVDYHVSPQEICFIPPFVFHHCVCPAEVMTMNIPPRMIRPSDLVTLEDRMVYPVDDDLAPIIQLIKRDVHRNAASSSIRYLFYYLYNKLVESNECRSIRYIREHFNEPISVEELAQLENYNVTYFADWFKKKTGQTPSVYLRDFRIERAKDLMDDGHRHSLLDIALQVGYSSHSAFTRAFKETVGCSPQEYKRQAEEQEFA